MKSEEWIKVLIQSPLGGVVDVATLDELIATGDSYEMYLANCGRVGSDCYKIIVQNEPQLLANIRLGRLKREGVFGDDSETSAARNDEKAAAVE